jgi:hypothetical protein
LVVFIIINALFGIIRLESKLLDHFEDLRFSWDRVLANDEAFVLAYRDILIKPSMLPDVISIETSFRVCVHDLSKDIPSILGHKLW